MALSWKLILVVAIVITLNIQVVYSHKEMQGRGGLIANVIERSLAKRSVRAYSLPQPPNGIQSWPFSRSLARRSVKAGQPPMSGLRAYSFQVKKCPPFCAG